MKADKKNKNNRSNETIERFVSRLDSVASFKELKWTQTHFVFSTSADNRACPLISLGWFRPVYVKCNSSDRRH